MENKIKVFATDGLSKEGVEILEKSGLFDITVNSKTSREDLLAEVEKYEALIIRSASEADAEVIEKGKNLKLIARAGVGLDNVDIKKATEKGIVVMNAPGGNTTSTAELSFAMLMASARNIPQAYASMKEKRWDKKKFKGVELSGKTLGVVGLGRIGREVVKRAVAFGMKVVGYDPFFTQEQASKIGLMMLDLPTLFKESDFITVHTPLTDDTRDMISLKEMKTMKPTVRLINCARGGIINEEDVKTALKEGIIAGAALDVYTEEPLKDYSFLEYDNCITTPHLGASTMEAQISVAMETADALVSYFKDGVPKNSVNFPTVPAHELNDMKDFVNLGDRMGYFLSQVAQKRVKELDVSYSGIIAEKQTKMITTAVLKGFLGGAGEEEVNFVNAPVIAKGRGIDITESTTANANVYNDIIAIKIKTDGGEYEIWGTIFSDGSARIVKYNSYHFELKPEGTMLFMFNNDKPGFIGTIGSVMGKHEINIADMTVVRENADEPALTICRIDTLPSKEVIEEVKALQNIQSVKLFTLK